MAAGSIGHVLGELETMVGHVFDGMLNVKGPNKHWSESVLF